MATAISIVKSATEVVLGIGEVSIDNFTFKLFYKWSVTIFITGSVAVSSSQFFGDPIACETPRVDKFQADDSVDEDVLNAYCWMYSTFDIPPDFKGTCTRRVYDGKYLYHSYYQFVSVFLMVQAVLLYTPRCIWLAMEGGLMHFLVKDKTGRVIDEPEKKKSRLLVNYREHVHNKFNKYAFGFFFCEFLNIFILVGQILFIHAFLNYKYLDYGLQVYRYYMLPIEEREYLLAYNPMCEVFPKVASCSYQRYGRGGGQETKNAICILSLNIINDKVFVILWFWHVILLVTGLIRIVTRGVQLCSARVRFFLLRLQMHRYFSNNKHLTGIRHYILTCSIGDWFVLYQMSKNLNKRFFAEFLALLSLTVNPDPELDQDPEIDITAKILNGGGTISKDDGDGDDDEGNDGGGGCGGEYGEEMEEMDVGHKASSARRKMKKDQQKALTKKQKAMVTHAGLKAMKKKK